MKPEEFFALAERIESALAGGEILFCGLSGEVSDFCRLSRGRIRQAGGVRTATLSMTLIDGARQAEAVLDLCGDPDRDLALARDLLGRLRERLPYLPEDPYLSFSSEPRQEQRQVGGDLPDPRSVISDLVQGAGGLDLVGIWASGEVSEGLASSIGHRLWHGSRSYNLDWSAYLEADRAVKATIGGLDWDPARLEDRLADMRRGLDIMSRPARTLEPGRYPAYLAPAALGELMDMLAWGGFDLKSHRTRQTPLLKLVRGERAFHPALSIREDNARGLLPGFTGEGFAKPGAVDLIEAGRFGRCLVDARDGKEYGEQVNAAGGWPESLSVAPGEIPEAEVAGRLGTGLFIGHLWYCNWSDPNECRVTGMTRFGTFWAEGGELVAPVSVMRFDDSLYHLLGDRLAGLTRERELMISPGTYDGRNTASQLVPGILVSGIDLAL